MSFVPGAYITPTIRLLEPLGHGGMGSVWVAEHVALNTKVVVKFMSENLAQNADALARFKREAAAASAVKSPHVVQMFDYGLAPNGSPYLVMELLEGEDLRHRLDRVHSMAPGEIVAIISQVCKALTRAHERGVVHRDIKPENIFLSDAGGGEIFVKVLDFGIAKTFDPSSLGATKTGSVLGTPYYMSPEQVLGSKSIDHRTDLWSVGVVVFQALAGARPFDAETIGGISIAICHGDLPRLSTVRSGLPAEMDEWFSRACARDPNLRFQTARELADALDVAARGNPAPRVEHRSMPPATSGSALLMSTTAGSSFAQQALDPPRRSPLTAIVAIVALSVVAAGIGIAAVLLRAPAAPPVVESKEDPEPAPKKKPKAAAAATTVDEIQPVATPPALPAPSPLLSNPVSKTPAPSPPSAKPLASASSQPPQKAPAAKATAPNDPTIF
ncbi:MAG: serine/threonine-protein kinase [Polyangiales bacterium]